LAEVNAPIFLRFSRFTLLTISLISMLGGMENLCVVAKSAVVLG
jgi:hypothetical protein